MPFYLVTLLDSANVPTVENKRSVLVHAASANDAKAAAKSQVSYDGDAAWDAATVTELTAQPDLIGIEFRAYITPDSDDYSRPYSAIGKAAIAAGACTMTIAAPGVITKTAHGFDEGDPVVFATTGALPTGLTAGTTYYVRKIDADSFSVSTKYLGAKITTSGSQSGTHTVRRVETSTVTGLLTQLAAVMNADALIDLGTDVAVSGLVLTIHADSKVGDRAITFGCYKDGVAFTGITGTVSNTGAEGSNRTITISGGSMAGSRLRITIADGTNPVDISVWLHDGETIDAAAARILVLLNAATLIGGTDATYGSNAISIPADNNVGDKVITCTWTRDGVAIPELAATVNAAAGAASIRTITFAADGTLPIPTVPKVLAAVRV